MPIIPTWYGKRNLERKYSCVEGINWGFNSYFSSLLPMELRVATLERHAWSGEGKQEYWCRSALALYTPTRMYEIA